MESWDDLSLYAKAAVSFFLLLGLASLAMGQILPAVFFFFIVVARLCFLEKFKNL